MTGKKKKKSQFSSSQIGRVPLHRPPGTSPRPRSRLAGFLLASSLFLALTNPVHPLGPAPASQTAAEPREGRARGAARRGADGRVKAGQTRGQHRAKPGVQVPRVLAQLGPGASRGSEQTSPGRWRWRRVWRRARRGRSASLLPSESRNKRLRHGTNARRALHLSGFPRLWSLGRCPAKGERLRLATNEALLSEGLTGRWLRRVSVAQSVSAFGC